MPAPGFLLNVMLVWGLYIGVLLDEEMWRWEEQEMEVKALEGSQGGSRREESILGAQRPKYFAVSLCLVKGNGKTHLYFRPRAQRTCNATTDHTGMWKDKAAPKSPVPSCLFRRDFAVLPKLQLLTVGLSSSKQLRVSIWYLIIGSVRSHTVLGVSHD